MDFKNKVVLITGAGSGIGQATALEFAKLSAKLSLVDINEDGLKKTAENCDKEAAVLKVIADLTKDDDVKKIVEVTLNEYKKIVVLVQCAGIYSEDSILDNNLMASYDRLMNLNLRAVVRLTNLAAPALVKSKGCILLISSAVANKNTKGCLSYNVGKAALCYFSKCIALELGPQGVRVNSILPGLVKTSILSNTGYKEEDIDELWNKFKDISALKRIIMPEEIANIIVYLASEKAKSITGADFTIDAGWTLST